jgi:ribonuclease HII
MRLFDDSDIALFHPAAAFDEAVREEHGRPFVCGVDEVGRGALSGSICAAAIILKPSAIHIDIKDSKRFSSRNRRETVADQILQNCMDHSVAWVDAKTIDEIGIQEANRVVMIEAIRGLGVDGDDLVAILDGNQLWPGGTNGAKCVWVTGGDSESQSVAAASIIAKVSRDRVMEGLGEQYPEYGFERHVGYGAPEHMAAIRKHGMIPGIHRQSFIHIGDDD